MQVKRIFKGFASDNNSGVHPEIMEAMSHVNRGHVVAYGDDPFTGEAEEIFKRHFGSDIDVYFVYNGTAANVLGIKASLSSHQAVICAETAHLNVDECGAPENHTGCKLLTVPSPDGKIHVEDIKKHLHSIGFEHHSQPGMISLTQATELGTVYTPEEIKKITDFARENRLLVHMDGARLANAAAALGVEPNHITGKAGVDILSFGGTKNGMMFGEAVVFFNRDLARYFKYIRKQGMQLGSKLRFISAQFTALLSGDLWLQNARQANEMALLLAEKIEKIPQIKITQKVETNGVFATIPKEHIPALREAYPFYIWNEEISEVRWMTSFDTTEEDITAFSRLLEERLG